MQRSYVREGLALFDGWGDREALVAITGRRYSYGDVAAAIRNTAALFWNEGLRPGDTICFLLSNPAEAYFSQFAAHLIGCRTAYLNRTAPTRHSISFLELIKPDAFVYETSVAAELGPLLAKEMPGARLMSIGAADGAVNIVDPPAVEHLPFDPVEITNEPDSIFQSSGTTAIAKLIRHGDGFFTGVQSVADYYRPADGRPIRFLVVSGAWHAAGQSGALVTWFSGGTMVNIFPFSPEGVLKTIKDERITAAMGSPSMLYAILDAPELAEADLSSLTCFTVSAGPATPARLRHGVEVFGASLNVVYGMAELPFISALPRVSEVVDRAELLASCGKPWGDASVEIRDDDGQLLAAGAVGDIWVSGGQMFKEYFANPELTAQALYGDWMRTTDMGYLDSAGYLYIVDRRADLIATAGDKVFSRPIEDTLAEFPGVAQAAVIAVPDPVHDEVAYAYVVPVDGVTLDADALKAFVTDRLNENWTPHFIEFVTALPLTEFGKVDKKALRNLDRNI